MDDNTELASAKQTRDRHHSEGRVSQEFNNLADFKQHALSPSWDPSQDRIHISDIPYRLATKQPIDFIKVLNRTTPLVVIYKQAGGAWSAEGRKTGLAQWIVIAWRKFNGNIFKPSAVFTTRPHVFSGRVKELSASPSMDDPRNIDEAIDKENLIGATAMMKVTSLSHSGELKCRVDTGATISSIHCDGWKVNGESVTFTNKELSPNAITLPLITHQATKSSDGRVENRPVIELNVRINGKVLQGMQFNLNNREHMEYPVLIGQNVLQKGKFLIDPSMVSEEGEDDFEIDYDSLMEELEPLLLESADSTEKEEQTRTVLEVLRESDITFSDFVKQCRRLEYAGPDEADK
jgi:hypothetical protein